jgi:hypothetical protein
MALGNTVAARVAALIGRLGQPVTIHHGGAAQASLAVVDIMTAGVRAAQFRTAEITNWIAPAYVVTLAGEGPPVAVGDTVTFPVESVPTDFPVRKIARPRLGEVVVKTQLFVAQTVATGDGVGTGVTEW